MGEVESIHVAAVAGGAMVPQASVAARRGVGLVGDRYAAGAGYWQDARVSRDLTLVESEVVDDLRRNDQQRKSGHASPLVGEKPGSSTARQL